MLLFAFLHEESRSIEARDQPSRAKPGREGAAAASNAPVLLRLLNSQGPRLHFAVPPFITGRIFGVCFSPHELTSGHLLLLLRCLRQYVVLTPTFAIFRLWAALVVGDHSDYLLAERCIEVGSKLSTVVALYALLVLYFATHDILLDYRTTAKFFAVKIFLLITLIQEPLLERAVGHVHGHTHAGPGHCLHGLNLAHFWSMWARALESVGMALLLRYAFRAHELEAQLPGAGVEGGRLWVELELKRFDSPTDKRSAGASAAAPYTSLDAEDALVWGAALGCVPLAAQSLDPEHDARREAVVTAPSSPAATPADGSVQY